jgi:YbbR domain-containing protein
VVEVKKNKTVKAARLWIYKLAAVVAAALIWVMVTITQNPLDEKIFMISLEQHAVSENLILELLDNNINKIQVRIQAPAVAIKELTEADIAVYVNLAGFKAGKYELAVMVDHPDNIQVLSLRPSSIEVELKETLTQVFPLEAEVLGEPAVGYKQMEALLSPVEIKLTGAEDQIQRVAKVYVAASVQDIDESYDKDLSVMALDAAGADISAMFTIEPKVARLVIPVMYEQPERMVAVRVPTTGQTAPGYQVSLISASPPMVRVFGDLIRLQSLYYVDTEPVDVSELNTNTSLTVRLKPAGGFTTYPREVTVALQIEPVDSVTVTKSIILCQNVGEGCTAEVEQFMLSVTVYGPETFIAALEEADIVPYVDCEGLPGGNYELPILVSLPANIAQMNISRDTAKVTIIAPEQEGPAEENGAEVALE